MDQSGLTKDTSRPQSAADPRGPVSEADPSLVPEATAPVMPGIIVIHSASHQLPLFVVEFRSLPASLPPCCSDRSATPRSPHPHSCCAQSELGAGFGLLVQPAPPASAFPEYHHWQHRQPARQHHSLAGRGVLVVVAAGLFSLGRSVPPHPDGLGERAGPSPAEHKTA